MLIVRRSGAREAGRLQQEMEEVFRSLVMGVRPVSRSQIGVWRPPVEVYENDGALVVTLELAGVREDDVQVVVDDSVLHVSGVRHNASAAQKRTYHEMGIAYGPFEAVVFLPFAVAIDDVEAIYENGFLRVTLPRANATRIVPREVSESAQH
ncbi:MAG: Hsp20/alpha crystallin family protein [Thermomicrobiaceae bacterium]|nr:Hsp20/alpha crystallin family protein [Thermomicrobiaceae bacterium]